MSWATCYGASNNIHFDFPPLMSDGRNFSTWTPACKINEQIKKANHIGTNWEYRRYLRFTTISGALPIPVHGHEVVLPQHVALCPRAVLDDGGDHTDLRYVHAASDVARQTSCNKS